MIVVYHKNNKVVDIKRNQESIVLKNNSIADALFNAAEKYNNELIIWCNEDLKENLNVENLPHIFHHNRIMASYSTFENLFLSDGIGYVDGSPFIKINKKVSYPTWQMSTCVGGVHGSVLKTFRNEIFADKNFDYFLQSFAKLAMPQGLFCYSEPQLLSDLSERKNQYRNNKYLLFRFVKQHYKKRWVFLLFLNSLVYEKTMPFLPFIFSFFYCKRKVDSNLLETIEIKSTNKTVEYGNVDVIIPTIGRKEYLYDVLKDLSKQTKLPQKVIIVEQNANPNSTSELGYLTDEEWLFEVKHIFTHQTGVCNARNLALNEVESEWVFLNDDDNRFDENLLNDTLEKALLYGANCLTTSYLQVDEKFKFKIANQSGIFGSGNSFVKTSCLKNISFNMALEFGYGEDIDFGMQLRNQGFDVLYFPELKIVHLKAPFGGFRIVPEFAWRDEKIQPKPSPTIMYIKQRHFSQCQVAGYKFILFFKTIRNEPLFNWFNFYKLFEKKWLISLKWSEKL